MNENFDAFDAFAMKYDMNEKMIAYKYNHSYRVVHQAEEIARSLNLDEEDKELASLIGLLHDIARFRQWTEYKTFSDHESIDHGDEGVKILFDEGEIKKFKVNHDYYDIIAKSVKYHNKIDIPEDDLTIREKMHCKIIRDADKLDILYSFSTNRLLEVDTDDEEISNTIHDEFMNHHLIRKNHIKSKNEQFLLMLGLVYDLNYKYSINRVYEEGYINKLFEHVKNKKIFKEYVDELNSYLKGKIKNDR